MDLNPHNKKEFPPMHTAEHILNQTMIRMFGCERSKNTHIEKKKSKCDYSLKVKPTDEQISIIEQRINEIISSNQTITTSFLKGDNLPDFIDTSKLPASVSETIRIVFVGDYDGCACIGDHVSNTNEIGTFKIVSADFNDGNFRIRFKLENCTFVSD